MTVLLFLAGVALLIVGGNCFVESSVSLAEHLRVPRILIGTTLVSLATTAPELAVSARASLLGQPGLAIGNALGSAIANIGFILGLLCVLKPMFVHREDFILPSRVMVGAGVLLAALSLTVGLARWAGLVLLGCGVGYLVVDYRRHGLGVVGAGEAAEAEAAVGVMSLPRAVVFFAAGTVMVIGGSELLCTHGVAIAEGLRVPPFLIGLTMVAFGTSVPELVTAIHAARKGVPDLSLGNVVGANILNLTVVTGTAATIAPLVVRERLQHIYTFAVMIAIFVLLKVMARTGKRLTRKEGYVLIACYGVYLVGLVAIGR